MPSFDASSIYQYLLKEYGDQFVKFIVAEKSKGIAEKKFFEVSDKAQ